MSVIQLFAREDRERQTFGQLSGALRQGQFRSTFYDASLYATVEALQSLEEPEKVASDEASGESGQGSTE